MNVGWVWHGSACEVRLGEGLITVRAGRRVVRWSCSRRAAAGRGQGREHGVEIAPKFDRLGSLFGDTARDQVRPCQHRKNRNDHDLSVFPRIPPQAPPCRVAAKPVSVPLTGAVYFVLQNPPFFPPTRSSFPIFFRSATICPILVLPSPAAFAISSVL